jgi:hypothetical protein
LVLVLDLLGNVFFVGGLAPETAAREDIAVLVGFEFFFFGEAFLGGDVGVVVAGTTLSSLTARVVDVSVAVLVEWLCA